MSRRAPWPPQCIYLLGNFPESVFSWRGRAGADGACAQGAPAAGQGLPATNAKRKNAPIFYPRFYLCSSSSIQHASQFELVTYSSFCPLRFPIRNELPRHQKNQLIRHQNTFSNDAHHPCDAIPQQDLVSKWNGSDSVDAAGKVAQAVAVANEAAGLEGAGTLAAQVRKHS